MTPDKDTSSGGGDPSKGIRDIEDVFREVSHEDGDNTSHPGIRKVRIHTRRRDKGESEPVQEDPDECLEQSNDLRPERHKIYLKTWGCSHNTSDSEYMAGLLGQAGYPITNDKLNSSIWILNSCTVKGPSEAHFRNQVEEGKSLGKKVIVSGCVPQGEPKSDYIRGLSVIGVKQIDEIVGVVEEVLRGNTVRLLSFQRKNGNNNNGIVKKNPPGASLHFPKIRKNELIEIIPISTGCLNSCTYCKTKLARGNLSSYPMEEIVSRAKHVFRNEGVKEIWLTSEDLGAWGLDLGLTIVDLLTALVECIPPDCMMRIGMTNPPYILDHLKEIANILNHPHVYGFIHIPIQSASDPVLLEMKREYNRKQFEHIVTFLLDNVPNLTIATDIICGFPTETEQDFEETISLVEKYKFPALYMNQFYPRPGTVAAKMPRIASNIVKQRTKRLTELFHSYSAFDGSRIGKVYRGCLVTEISHDKMHYVAHNKAYEQILLNKGLFKDESEIMGRKVDVRITKVTKFSMIGVTVGDWFNSGVNGRSQVSQVLIGLLLAALVSLMLTFYWR